MRHVTRRVPISWRSTRTSQKSSGRAKPLTKLCAKSRNSVERAAPNKALLADVALAALGSTRQNAKPLGRLDLMQWRYATDEDVKLLAELNRQLIVDEGHHNPMGMPSLERRMRAWLASEYRAVLF